MLKKNLKTQAPTDLFNSAHRAFCTDSSLSVQFYALIPSYAKITSKKVTEKIN